MSCRELVPEDHALEELTKVVDLSTKLRYFVSGRRRMERRLRERQGRDGGLGKLCWWQGCTHSRLRRCRREKRWADVWLLVDG